MNKLLKIISGIAFIGWAFAGQCEARNIIPKDSVGIKTIRGKSFIIHKVKAGEGLYGIARRYRCQIVDIKAANPELKKLKPQQTLKIPYTKPVQRNNAASKSPTSVNASAQQQHTVKAGETVYSISRRYGMAPKKLLAANKLSSPALSLGQVLKIPASNHKTSNKNAVRTHIVTSNETLYSIARRYNVAVNEVKAWNKLKSNSLTPGQRLIVGKTGASEWSVAQDTLGQRPKDPKKNVSVELKDILSVVEERKVDENGRVVEVGQAKLIPRSEDSEKFLALHRSAPRGTMITVINESNKLEVLVRVIGKLPDTGSNEKVMIRISHRAYERLGAVNEVFPVKLRYILGKAGH